MSKATGQIGTFGDRLAAWRGHRAWSVNEAAQRAGVDHAAWLRWESGKGEPQMRVLRKIAAAFGVSMSDLLRGIE